MDRGAWWATVHGVTESDMTEWLNDDDDTAIYFHSITVKSLRVIFKWRKWETEWKRPSNSNYSINSIIRGQLTSIIEVLLQRWIPTLWDNLCNISHKYFPLGTPHSSMESNSKFKIGYSFLTKDQTWAPPALAAQGLSHWTTREIPGICFLILFIP